MRYHYFTILLSILAFTSYSQDTITTRRGNVILSRVIEITSSEIRYINPENPDGPIYFLDKSEVKMISYPNGYKESFENIPTVDSVNYYLEGEIDAFRYYKGYKGAATGTFVTSIVVSPLIGLIPAIACSSTRPKDKNLDYPDTDLYHQQIDYQRGYNHKAKRIKQDRVWRTWGMALLLNFAIYAVLTR